MRNDRNTTYHQGSRSETLATFAVSGITLVALLAVGYFAPTLLVAALH